MAEASVREANERDASAIAELHARTWRYAYAELLPAAVLDALDPEQTTAQWRAVLTAETTTFVAFEGTFLVGCCVAGSAPREDLAGVGEEVPEDAEHIGMIGTLLVEPRWGRRGHGGRLLGTAARLLREQGHTRGITWVPEADQASLAFYERAGWRADGLVRTYDAEGTQVREARMAGTLELYLE